MPILALVGFQQVFNGWMDGWMGRRKRRRKRRRKGGRGKGESVCGYMGGVVNMPSPRLFVLFICVDEHLP